MAKEKKYGGGIENTEVSVNKGSVNTENLEEDLSEIFKEGDYRKISAKLLELTYSEDGFLRDSAIIAISIIGRNIPKDMIRKAVKRLLEISDDPYVGHHLPEAIGGISDNVPEDLKDKVIEFLISLSKTQNAQMYVRMPKISSGDVEMKPELIDDTEYMRVSAVTALLKFRERISESLSESLVNEIIHSSDLRMEKYRIELIKSMRDVIPERIKMDFADKIIKKTEDKNPEKRIEGMKIIGEILSLFPEEVIINLGNTLLVNLKDKNSNVKTNAMEVFEKICGSLDEKTRVKFIEELILQSYSTDWMVRLRIAKTLGEIKDYIPYNIRDKIIKIMKDLIKDKEPLVKIQALNSLSRMSKLFSLPEQRG